MPRLMPPRGNVYACSRDGLGNDLIDFDDCRVYFLREKESCGGDEDINVYRTRHGTYVLHSRDSLSYPDGELKVITRDEAFRLMAEWTDGYIPDGERGLVALEQWPPLPEPDSASGSHVADPGPRSSLDRFFVECAIRNGHARWSHLKGKPGSDHSIIISLDDGSNSVLQLPRPKLNETAKRVEAPAADPGSGSYLGLILDEARREISRAGFRPVRMTGRRRWAVLELLMANRDCFTDEKAVRKAWPDGENGGPEPSTIRDAISELGKFLRPLGVRIANERSFGWRLVDA